MSDERAALTSDLELARAALAGDPKAIADLDRLLLRASKVLSKLGLREVQRDEVVQSVRTKLLVHEKAPALERYEGRGSLLSWLRASLLRTGLNVLRADRSDQVELDESGLGLAASQLGQELELLKKVYGTPTKRALAAALASLSSRERLLLAQHYLDGLSLVELARLHGVHDATISRWLQSARSKVRAEVELALEGDLALAPDERSQVLMLVRSQLSGSLGGLLTISGKF